jgi:pyruvate formate lyase activating enzyme
MYSAVYGYPASIGVDPVEKKPLYHFKPGVLAYSMGTLGCNFSCSNCHNWKISQAEKIKEAQETLDYMTPEKIVCAALEEGCEAIAFTYNEPTVFTEYALDIMKLAHDNGLSNIWVSNGYMSADCLEAILPYLDAINVDLKSINSNFYKNICSSELKPVLQNLVALKQEQAHLEISTLVIPSLNDDFDILTELAEFIANDLGTDTPWHINRFSPINSWKLKDLEAANEDIMYEAFEIGKNSGLRYVYVGNMPGDQKQCTYCPKCGELAISRSTHGIERYDSRGRCSYCDKNLDIIE